jgi:hypothetical protein
MNRKQDYVTGKEQYQEHSSNFIDLSDCNSIYHFLYKHNFRWRFTD